MYLQHYVKDKESGELEAETEKNGLMGGLREQGGVKMNQKA